MFSLWVFFPQCLDKWTSPHSLPEDMIVINPVEAACPSRRQKLLNKHKRKLGWKTHEDMSHEFLSVLISITSCPLTGK